MEPRAERQESFPNMYPPTTGDQLWRLGMAPHGPNIQEPPRISATLQDPRWAAHQTELNEPASNSQRHAFSFSNQGSISTAGPASGELGYPAMQADISLPPLHLPPLHLPPLRLDYEPGVQAPTSQWTPSTTTPIPLPAARPIATSLQTGNQVSPMRDTPAATGGCQRRIVRRTPAEVSWKRNKAEMEKLYLQQKLPLRVIMKHMSETHGFQAR